MAYTEEEIKKWYEANKRLMGKIKDDGFGVQCTLDSLQLRNVDTLLMNLYSDNLQSVEDKGENHDS